MANTPKRRTHELSDLYFTVRTKLRTLEANRDLLLDRLAQFDADSPLGRKLEEFGHLFERCCLTKKLELLDDTGLKAVDALADEAQEALKSLLGEFTDWLGNSPVADRLLRVIRILRAKRLEIRHSYRETNDFQTRRLHNFDSAADRLEEALNEALPALDRMQEIPSEWFERVKELVISWNAVEACLGDDITTIESLLLGDQDPQQDEQPAAHAASV